MAFREIKSQLDWNEYESFSIKKGHFDDPIEIISHERIRINYTYPLKINIFKDSECIIYQTDSTLGGQKDICCFDDAKVSILDSLIITGFDRSNISARRSSAVEANQRCRVDAYDNSVIIAHNDAFASMHDASHLICGKNRSDRVVGEIWGLNVTVEAFNNSKIKFKTWRKYNDR